MTRTAQFYAHAGQALVDEDNYPPEVVRHLALERRLLHAQLTAGRYDAAVEVGCMDGRLHAATILEAGVDYLGIDLVEASIVALRDRLGSLPPGGPRRSARVLDVCALAGARDACEGRVLVVFPFNAFGNLEAPVRAVAAVARCGWDLLIFTYGTDEASTRLRETYYARCSYAALTRVRDEKGVLFTAAEGLRSYAYEGPWLRSQLQAHGLAVETVGFGAMGRAVLGCGARGGPGAEVRR